MSDYDWDTSALGAAMSKLPMADPRRKDFINLTIQANESRTFEKMALAYRSKWREATQELEKLRKP